MLVNVLVLLITEVIPLFVFLTFCSLFMILMSRKISHELLLSWLTFIFTAIMVVLLVIYEISLKEIVAEYIFNYLISL